MPLSVSLSLFLENKDTFLLRSDKLHRVRELNCVLELVGSINFSYAQSKDLFSFLFKGTLFIRMSCCDDKHLHRGIFRRAYVLYIDYLLAIYCVSQYLFCVCLNLEPIDSNTCMYICDNKRPINYFKRIFV